MSKSWKLVLMVLALLVGCCLTTAQKATAQSLPSTATKAYIYNPSSPKTVVMVMPAATPISQITMKRISPSPATQSLTPYNGGGYFIINTGEKWEMMNLNAGNLLSVSIGFGQFPNVCPQSTAAGINATPCTFGPPQAGYPNGFPSGGCCPPAFPDVNNPVTNTIFPDLPNGSNSAEFTLNSAGGEAVDISCNKGANCKLQVTVTPPAVGPFWTVAFCDPSLNTSCGGLSGNTKCSGTGLFKVCTRTYKSTTSTTNSWVNVKLSCDDNCVDSTGCPRNGVFPYGCSQCNINPDPAISCRNSVLPAQCQIVTAMYTGQYCVANNGSGRASGNPNQGSGCQYVRSSLASGAFGGSVQVTYLGPLSPPAACTTPATPKCGSPQVL